MYQSSHFNKETPVALSIIADTVQNPAFLPEEIESQRDAARYEIREINAKPELVLPETLHEVAYGGKTLGNPILCPEDRIDQIDDAALRSFMEQWYRPERMVIAGAGMVHEELVELVHKHFSSLKGVPPPSVHPQPLQSSSRQNIVPPHLLPSASNPPSLYRSLSQAASSYLYPGATNNALATDSVLHHNTPTPAASYVGGHYFIHQPDAEFNHIYLAFEGPGVHSPDIYALATIQTLLGGGGSFSAGGPGKGMYSRLYTHILNHHPQVDHCEAFHHIYSDSSLVGLFASFVPASSPRHGNSPAQILPHLAHQISLLIHAPIGSAELQKAKNQLKSSLMMALESRAVEVEDLGRQASVPPFPLKCDLYSYLPFFDSPQILVHDRKIPVSEMCDRIDELSSDDLRNVATRYFGDEHAKCATVLVMGREDVGDWRGILRKYGVGGHK